jgi:hypothetical protein
MNSVEALDFAIARLRRSTSWGRRGSGGYAEQAAAAIRTLEALREHLADQQATAWRAVGAHAVERAGAPLREVD